MGQLTRSKRKRKTLYNEINSHTRDLIFFFWCEWAGSDTIVKVDVGEIRAQIYDNNSQRLDAIVNGVTEIYKLP